MDVEGRHSAREQLIPVGTGQIETVAPRPIATTEPRSTLRTVLAFERIADRVVDLIAARTNARPDAGDDVDGRHAMSVEGIDSCQHDTGRRPPPPGVNGGNSATFRVGQQDGHTIGDSHENHAIRIGRHDRIRLRIRSRHTARLDNRH